VLRNLQKFPDTAAGVLPQQEETLENETCPFPHIPHGPTTYLAMPGTTSAPTCPSEETGQS